MSIFSKIGKAARGVIGKAAPFLGAVPGPVGIVGKALGIATRVGGAFAGAAAVGGAIRAVPAVLPRVLPGLGAGAVGGGVAGMFLGGGDGGAPRRVSMRAIQRSAMSYCRRHPAWCTQVGGVGQVQELVMSGQLPIIRRRRAKGISGRDLRAFTRTARILKRYYSPATRARSPRSRH